MSEETSRGHLVQPLV